MAFFIATGTISNDVVRKETRNGVLATFRLETGAPRGRKLWIDVECWGHLAGTIAHHGESGRSVNVSGRLTQKTWRDNATGAARERIVVTALDADLISVQADALLVPNSVVARGTVDRVLPNRFTRSGVVTCLEVSTGRAGTKTGRLVLHVEHWSSCDVASIQLDSHVAIAAFGSLSVRPASSPLGAGPFLDARALSSS